MAIDGAESRREAGKRLKRFVLDRMAERGVGTLVQLAEDAPVSYDTLHAWFRGRAPDPGAGGRVALRLGVTYSELLAVYEDVSASGRYVRDDELRALVEAAAEAAVRRVLGERDGQGPSG